MQKVLKFTLIFGAAAGAAYFLFFLLMYFTIENPLGNKLAPLGLQVIVILYGIWYFKKSSDNYLHFFEGFTIGIGGTFLAALLSGLLVYLFLVLIDLQPFQTWIRESVAFLIGDRENKKEILSDEAYSRMLEAVKNTKPYMVIPDRLMASFWVVFPVGLYIMVLRKTKPL
ncbi:MAG: DUF4199 domain-containing protein [Leadbetterella sp.]|nr:DUF4199 domain-containing protein [Leadbetterella sp.]